MSHMEDDDPPIKSHPASREYRENFGRIFGAEEKSDTAENDDTSTKVEDFHMPDCKKICTAGADCNCGSDEP